MGRRYHTFPKNATVFLKEFTGIPSRVPSPRVPNLPSPLFVWAWRICEYSIYIVVGNILSTPCCGVSSDQHVLESPLDKNMQKPLKKEGVFIEILLNPYIMFITGGGGNARNFDREATETTTKTLGGRTAIAGRGQGGFGNGRRTGDSDLCVGAGNGGRGYAGRGSEQARAQNLCPKFVF
jgi:hypothetical protein